MLTSSSMRVAAIADLHIGATERTDFFRHDLSRFSRWLDDLERAHELIVVLGDLYQTQHSLGFGETAARRQLRQARQRVRPLVERLERAPYRYLHGNHDRVAARLVGAEEDLLVEHDGYRVFFTHGHQFDPILQRAYPISRFATWLNGRLAAAGLRALADYLEQKDADLKHARLDERYRLAATGLLGKHDADLIVMGHTHQLGRYPLPGGAMVLAGTCSRGRLMGVSIDLAARRVALLQPRTRH